MAGTRWTCMLVGGGRGGDCGWVEVEQRERQIESEGRQRIKKERKGREKESEENPQRKLENEQAGSRWLYGLNKEQSAG